MPSIRMDPWIRNTQKGALIVSAGALTAAGGIAAIGAIGSAPVISIPITGTVGAVTVGGEVVGTTVVIGTFEVTAGQVLVGGAAIGGAIFMTGRPLEDINRDIEYYEGKLASMERAAKQQGQLRDGVPGLPYIWEKTQEILIALYKELGEATGGMGLSHFFSGRKNGNEYASTYFDRD